MTISDVESQQTDWLTCGNKAAGDFLRLWRSYVHAIDDIVDESPGTEHLLGTFAMAIQVYTHPFFVANAASLKQLAVNCTNAYADSVAWEKSDTEWKRQFADHYRHFAAEMVLAIASICGGYSHMREASKVLREICWKEHHNEKGEAV